MKTKFNDFINEGDKIDFFKIGDHFIRKNGKHRIGIRGEDMDIVYDIVSAPSDSNTYKMRNSRVELTWHKNDTLIKTEDGEHINIKDIKK